MITARPTFSGADPGNVGLAGSFAFLGRVDERLAQLAAQRRAPAGPRPGSAPASPQVGVGTARWARRTRSKPSRSARSNAVRASARLVGRPPGSRAGTMPSSSGVPASHTAPNASRAAGEAVRPATDGRVASTPIATAPTRAEHPPAAAGRRSSARPPARRPPATSSRSTSAAAGLRHRADRAVAGRRGHAAGQHRGQRRLVELEQHGRPGARRRPRRRARAAPRRGWRRTRARRRGR